MLLWFNLYQNSHQGLTRSAPHPRSLETCFLCHYAHCDDLLLTTHNSAEVQDWLQQAKHQLVRRYAGRPSDFARVAVAYAKAAAERMEMWKSIDGGRRVSAPQRTFEEAKKWEYHFPRPKSPSKLPAGGKAAAAEDTKPPSCNKRPRQAASSR